MYTWFFRIFFLLSTNDVVVLGRMNVHRHVSSPQTIQNAHVSLELTHDGLPGVQAIHFAPHSGTGELEGYRLLATKEGKPPQLPEPQIKIIRPRISTQVESFETRHKKSNFTPLALLQSSTIEGSSALGRLGVLFRRPWHRNRKASKEVHPSDLFQSADFRHWFYMAWAIIFFLIVRYRHCQHTRDKDERHLTNVKLLGIWAFMAGCYTSVIYWDVGRYPAMDWLSGYMMELIFSLENIFLFLSIIEAFKTPQRLTTGLLTIVAFCQVLYQCVLFMGAAHWLKRMTWLPYAMGVWLLGVAAYAFMRLLGAKHSSVPGSRFLTPRNPDDDIYEVSLLGSPILSILRRLFGKRVIVSYAEDSAFVERSGKWYLTLLAPVFICLLFADFVMEIDVSFTKIEEVENPYIGFSSSALAAFMMPELFWLARIFFERFRLLHYGVAVILAFFGFQLLLEGLISILPLVECGIQMGVLVICVISSQAMGLKNKGINSDSDSDTNYPGSKLHSGADTQRNRILETGKFKDSPADRKSVV